MRVNSYDLYAIPGDRREWQAIMEDTGVVRNYEKQHWRYNGTIVWVRDNARAVRDATGRVVSTEGSVEDITDLNLALNATEAMSRGGQLLVRTTRTSQPAGVRIGFTDNGNGIAPDILPLIFNPFYRRAKLTFFRIN